MYRGSQEVSAIKNAQSINSPEFSDFSYLLARGEVESEWNCRLLSLTLKLFTNYEVAVIVEDQLVREWVKEEVIVEEFVAPGQMKVDQSQWSLFLYK